MPDRKRALFVNSLSGFKSANLIGTQDINGRTNLAIFSSVVHLGANPALVGLVMRPDNNDRHTLDNIINTVHYTINQVSETFYQQAHQTSARYPRNKSEFEQVGLHAQHVDSIIAPFVLESRLKYALKLKEVIPITHNNTQFVIGEIIHVICEDEAIQADGYIDIQSLETVSVSGLDSYHTNQRLSRLTYAKTDSPTRKLDGE
jgi:flavin reductase (DIM6/NTAB) family NADH-FMN oxidoreductase RutF